MKGNFFLVLMLGGVLGCSENEFDFGVTGITPLSEEDTVASLQKISWSEAQNGMAIGIHPLPLVVKRGEALNIDFCLSNAGDDILYVVPAVISDIDDIVQVRIVGPAGPIKYKGKQYAHILSLDVLKSRQNKAYRIKLLPKYWDISSRGCYSLSLVYQVVPRAQNDNRSIWSGSMVTPVRFFTVSE